MPQIFTVGARSRFINALAWSAMLVAALMLGSGMWSGAQGLGLAAWGRWWMAALPPSWGTWLLGHGAWLIGLALALASAVLVVAVGLLRRLEWARRAFTALVMLGIVAHLGGLWMQQVYLVTWADAPLQQAGQLPRVADVLAAMLLATRSLAAAASLALCVLLGWVAWRLQQPGVRQEFA